jgi:hypothetical protein
MSEIAILVSSLPELQKHGIPFVFTDRHAAFATAEFHDTLERLDRNRLARIACTRFQT